MSAPATTSGVRVLEREAGTLHRRHVIDRDVVQVLRGKRIDEQLEPFLLDDEIVFGRLVFDQKAVFETAAAAGLDADAKSADIGRNALGVHETLDFGRGAGGNQDGDFGLLKSAHCNHLVEAVRKINVQLDCYKRLYPLRDNLLGRQGLPYHRSRNRVGHCSTDRCYTTVLPCRVHPVAEEDDEYPAIAVNPE